MLHGLAHTVCVSNSVAGGARGATYVYVLVQGVSLTAYKHLEKQDKRVLCPEAFNEEFVVLERVGCLGLSHLEMRCPVSLAMNRTTRQMLGAATAA